MRIKLLFICMLCSLYVQAADIYITPDSSLVDAVRKAREMRRLGQAKEITIHLAAGVYQLYEPLRLRPEDSGLRLVGPTAAPGSSEPVPQAVISGGLRITGWKQQGKLLVADVPDFNGCPIDFRQLWVDGKKAVRARDVSDFEKMKRILGYDKEHQILWIPKSVLPAPPAPAKAPVKTPAKGSANKKAAAPVQKTPPSGGKLEGAELVLHEMWCTSNLRIKSMTVHGDSVAVTFHNPEARILFEHPWPSPIASDSAGHASPFYLTNAKELLDEPGEWYHDIREHKLYYQPQAGETIKEAIVPVVETLVEMIGSAEQPVRDISIKGITFSHTTWMRPSEKGHVPLQAGMYLVEAYKLNPQMDRLNNHKLDNQGWVGRADAAVELRHTANIVFDGCRFEHLGGSGLDYVLGCKGGMVTGSTFTDIAMNGMVVGCFSPEGLETHRPYDPIDSREVCIQQTIKDCEFYDVTNEDWGCVAIAAGYVSNINIEHNTIHDISYTGISLGWGWNRDKGCMRGNRVFANLIYNYAQHMYDCAGIYTLGKQPGTVISENVVRDIAKPSYVHDPNHWFYLYTDEGSSSITMKNNWTPEEKFLQNANGPDNVWENNGPQVSEQIKNRAGIRNKK